MNFWQRRPIVVNVIGFLLVALLWWGLDAAGALLLDVLGAGISRKRGSLLPLAIAILVVTRLYDRMSPSWAGIGLHRWTGRELSAGSLLGVLMALVAWAPSALSGDVVAGPATPAGAVVDLLAYLLIGAMLEELAFRGYLFQRVVEIIGPVAATLGASVLFAVMHLQNPSVSAVAMLNIFIASILFSLCYFVTGSVWLPMAAHALWNITLAMIVGVPVSGIDFGGGLFRTIDGAPEIIGGGAFGPEGGLATTLALALGIVALLRVPGITLSPYVHAAVFRDVYRQDAERLPAEAPTEPVSSDRA
jgi:membrane protease YdiL (CAAX protease family)